MQHADFGALVPREHSRDKSFTAPLVRWASGRTSDWVSPLAFGSPPTHYIVSPVQPSSYASFRCRCSARWMALCPTAASRQNTRGLGQQPTGQHGELLIRISRIPGSYRDAGQELRCMSTTRRILWATGFLDCGCLVLDHGKNGHFCPCGWQDGTTARGDFHLRSPGRLPTETAKSEVFREDSWVCVWDGGSRRYQDIPEPPHPKLGGMDPPNDCSRQMSVLGNIRDGGEGGREGRGGRGGEEEEATGSLGRILPCCFLSR